ncbi:MAG: hypothetical protein ACYC2G_14060 [Gemmatimonadaceae bacterium]
MPAYPRTRRPSWLPELPLPIAAALLLAVAGCSAAGRRAAGDAVAPPTVTATPGGEARPLSGLVSRRVLLLPVQGVEAAPDVAAAGAAASLPAALDAELAFALGERGLGSLWTTAAGARRLATQNPGMGLEPGALPLPPARQLEGGAVLEPLAGQLRALAALADARYVVLPLTLQLSSAGGTDADRSGADPQPAARGTLRLLLVDVRAARILWSGATEPVELAVSSPAFAARVADSFADLIAAPRAP